MTQNTDLIKQFAALTPAQKARVLAKLQAQGALSDAQQAQSETTIPLIDRTVPIPLSFPQEQLWFLYQVEPESVAYNERIAIRLTGTADIAALQQATQAVVQRHEGLRTIFADAVDSADRQDDQTPVQLIQPFDPTVCQLTQCTVPDFGDELIRQIDEISFRPFDLRVGPLWRFVLFTSEAEADAGHVLLLVVHHMIADAWSMSIMLEDIAAYYTALRQGQQAQLPELTVTVADFSGWQRQQLQGETLTQHLAFWQDALAGASPLLPLPADYPRPATPPVGEVPCSGSGLGRH